MRRLKRFTTADLKAHPRTARDYVRQLLAGGYVEREQEGEALTRTTVLQLVRDVGLEAPKLQKDGTPSRMQRIERPLNLLLEHHLRGDK